MSEPVSRAFDRAHEYDRHAIVQRETARWLADTIVAEVPRARRVLEIGCGTGFLAEAIDGRLPGVDWLMTDISDGMLSRARARFEAHSGFRFARVDGERPRTLGDEAPFDLVCANLAVQWFEDLQLGLTRLFQLLAPGGRLMVTTLVAGTFRDWHAAHRAVGATPGTPDYPPARTLERAISASAGSAVDGRTFVQQHENARAFVRTLRAIGAGTPRSDHVPLSPGMLREVARRFEADGAIAHYEVALCRFVRPEE